MCQMWMMLEIRYGGLDKVFEYDIYGKNADVWDMVVEDLDKDKIL